jgi:hypothetical protein
MKLKMAANQVLKRFSGKIVKEDAAKYPNTFVDADGDLLSGDKNYKLTLPPNIPAKLFWSVTVYDALTASGLDNGQSFPSLNQMDKPAQADDGSTDIYFGPDSPGEGKNWVRTVPGKGYFVALRLYGPMKAFFDHSWKPGDIVSAVESKPASRGRNQNQPLFSLNRLELFWQGG